MIKKDILNKQYKIGFFEGLQKGLDLACEFARENGINMEFPRVEKIVDEIKSNVQKTNNGCGKEIKVYWNSEHPEEGYGIEKCQRGFLCKDCSHNLNKESSE